METTTLSAGRFFMRYDDCGRRRFRPVRGLFFAKPPTFARALFISLPRLSGPLVPALFLFAFLAAASSAPGAESASGPPASAAPAIPAPPLEAPADAPLFPEMRWTVPAPGLELGLSQLPESREKGSKAVFAVLRVDPALHGFSLGMASETGEALSLAGWSRKLGLRAGINASMYLPDNITSTGYMRNNSSLNNDKIGNKLGAFFVAGRRSGPGRPADIIERDPPASNWRETLDEYSIVIQNYRLTDSRGKVLWPPGGPLHSIAVVAKDQQGRIAFILSQEPLTAERFTHYLKAFPLALSTAMYVEGGAQAGLFLRVDKDAANSLPASFAGAQAFALPEGVVHVWKGRQSLLNTRGNPDAPVPNILGVSGPDGASPSYLVMPPAAQGGG